MTEPEHPVIRRASEEPTFYRSDLRDPVFYQAHKAEIIKAQARPGGIIDDLPEWRVGPKPKDAA